MFADLISEMSAVLDRNVSVAAVQAFKSQSLDKVDDLGAVVAERIPGLDGQHAREAIVAALIITAMLWPVANPPPHVTAMYAEIPALTWAHVDFEDRLQQLLSWAASCAAAAGSSEGDVAAGGDAPGDSVRAGDDAVVLADGEIVQSEPASTAGCSGLGLITAASAACPIASRRSPVPQAESAGLTSQMPGGSVLSTPAWALICAHQRYDDVISDLRV